MYLDGASFRSPYAGYLENWVASFYSESVLHSLGRTVDGKTVYSGTIRSPIVEGTLEISIGDWVISDQGNGVLSGDNGVSGTVHYSTGLWSVDLGANTVSAGATMGASYRRYFAPYHVFDLSCTVTNRMESNRAELNGGAVYATNSYLYFRHLNIVSNEAGLNGGGMFALGTRGVFDWEQEEQERQVGPTVVGTTIEWNTTYGGVLDNAPVVEGSLVIAASAFVFRDQGDGTLLGTDSTSGTINYHTGAWSIDVGVNWLQPGNPISACYVYVAPRSTVAIRATDIADTVFTGNSALGNGGGIHFESAGAECRGLTVVSNSATGHGAGICAAGVTKHLVLSKFQDRASRIEDNIGDAQVYNASPNTFSGDPLGEGNIDARNVWWGTRSASVIADGVFDFFDDAGKGFVFIEPISSLRLTLRTYGEGSISNNPALTYYDYGQVVNLAAIPNEYWRFTTWSNAVTGTNTATDLSIRGDLTVDAYFDAVLATNNVPLWWLATNGLSADDAGALSDSDGDGAPAWAERRAGTDPTNKSSVLAIRSFGIESNGVTISWSSVSNRTYSIVQSSDIAAGIWTSVTNGLMATAPLNVIDDVAPAPGQTFYRVTVD